jgi:aspartyl protease family protein
MLWFLLLLLATGGLILFLGGDQDTIAGLDPASFAGLVVGGALLLYFAASLGGSYRGRFGQALKDFTVWALIAFALVAVYSFRHEVEYVARRVAGELLPPGETVVLNDSQRGEQSVRVRRRPDGHFSIRTQVNGTAVTMMVDTGASSIVLRPADARLAGIDIDRLNYTVPVQTANGTAYAAAVRLRDVSVGPIKLDRVDALVAKPGVLNESLLGMNFLRRQRSYEFSGEFLTLRS